jgi:hypothetical protein
MSPAGGRVLDPEKDSAMLAAVSTGVNGRVHGRVSESFENWRDTVSTTVNRHQIYPHERKAKRLSLLMNSNP